LSSKLEKIEVNESKSLGFRECLTGDKTIAIIPRSLCGLIL